LSKPTLSPIEAHILRQLGGRRWTRKRFNKAIVKAAKADWKAVYTAAGFGTASMMTTDKTNPKMGKIGKRALGVTIHSANNALPVWNQADPSVQAALATALGTTVEEISRVLRFGVCPKSTEGCRTGCTPAKSARAQMDRTQLVRLVRHLFLLFKPAAAFAVIGNELRDAEFEHGVRGARWRVNISDDLRLELLAPGLFEVAPRPYSYTKWTPEERPGRQGFRLVYSASERTSDQQVVGWCRAGHRVAVVLDLLPSQPMPDTWNGIPVVDGDKTDDLWEHPKGVIVGLRAKGTLEVREAMLSCGFTKPANPSGPTPVQLVRRRPAKAAVPVEGRSAMAATPAA
jgi:hypothetical protein